MKYFFFTILALLLLLFSCKKIEKEQTQQDKNLPFVKTWYDTVMMIPMEERLEIKQNHTFKLVGGACTAGWWSEGSWVRKNDTIILNSFKPKECIHLSEYGAMCSTMEEFDKYPPEPSFKDCKPDSEEHYEVFINEKFYIKNDTLIHVKQNKKCGGQDIIYSPLKKVH